MNIINKDLKRRIIDISYEHKLSHIGSCLTAVDIIEHLYSLMLPNDKFILSQGHAGLALYVVLEKHNPAVDAVTLLSMCGIHPDRLQDPYGVIDYSTGSLGMGLPAGLGMALASPDKDIYVLTSDGELAEGSMYEASNFIEYHRPENLHVVVNANGYSGYQKIDVYTQPSTNFEFVQTDCDYLPFLKGLEGHYHVMNDENYKLAKEVLK